MAANDIDVKQKTSSSHVDFTRSTEVWYTDGSVVLVAEKTAFHVHGTILAAHCEIFKDMFAIPQPMKPDANTETYEKSQVLRLQDSPTDLKHFLKAIYDFSYFLPGAKTKFPVVAAVLRLGTKYDAPVLRQRAIDLLATAYPSSLAAWDQRASRRLVPPFEDELTAYIGLAVENDVRVILPGLYFAASKAPLPNILDQLHNLTVAPCIQWDVCRSFIIGRERLVLAEETSTLAFLQPDCLSPNCHDRSRCVNERNAASCRTLPKSDGSEPFYRWCLENPDLGKPPGPTLCSPCRDTATNSIKVGREKVWEHLPGFFGLPDWATLKARDGLDVDIL